MSTMTLDRKNLIDSVKSLRDRWMATTKHDGHDGDFDILLEVIERLKRDGNITSREAKGDDTELLKRLALLSTGEYDSDTIEGKTLGEYLDEACNRYRDKPAEHECDSCGGSGDVWDDGGTGCGGKWAKCEWCNNVDASHEDDV